MYFPKLKHKNYHRHRAWVHAFDNFTDPQDGSPVPKGFTQVVVYSPLTCMAIGNVAVQLNAQEAEEYLFFENEPKCQEFRKLWRQAKQEEQIARSAPLWGKWNEIIEEAFDCYGYTTPAQIYKYLNDHKMDYQQIYILRLIIAQRLVNGLPPLTKEQKKVAKIPHGQRVTH